MENSIQDLFETPELLPNEVKTILSRYNALEIEKGIDYADLIKLGQELANYGLEFDFYLDCIPYNLRKINN
jgi:hypothetical protein